MAKTYCFKLYRHQAKMFFSPLRKKNDVLKVLLEAVKVMVVSSPQRELDETEEYFTLNISKMSRLVFVSEHKIFSINFPFKVVEGEDSLTFFTSDQTLLDSYITSEAISFIADEDLVSSNSFLDFAAPIIESEADELSYFSLMKELFYFEDGYLRYDHDPVRQDEDMHPLNHFDVFYSSGATFKVGLTDRCYIAEVLDVLDVTTPCHYISSLR
ncbi:hypothetical protein F8A90_07085 [Cobetia sp. cqz5-12]|uniref:hypothetical protein n=1 Tax=Cobetia sp. cqz5-12 TaxID=2609415 RepID=UPI0019085308|nr:hypothetical protein [Cobetia sp. cqz5-12]QQK63916.1 hypothetical protein F8A90_07085 [Cobetia sp. cqz5-12]